MSSYRYLPLPSEGDYIRVLYLLPNEFEAEPLQCRLYQYSMQKSGLRTHRYEALSYAWGDPRKKRAIYVDGYQLLITINLYAALLCLRDHSLERIIWIDAICIDQTNLVEQGQQVSLMAKIYSSARGVIVWLGEKTRDVEGALEDIQYATNKGSAKRSDQETNQQAIISLLQRSWFQRIWVLQEVAAARHIIIMCGSTEIDGYAFCLGLKSLQKSQRLPDLASLGLQSVPSLINLIEQAGLRPKHIKSVDKYSLEITSLAELVDMFHTRQASDPRDKVYALLGMSSDDPSPASLQPNYRITWENLLQQLVEFVLGKDVFVETSGQSAVIKGKGCILGQVSSVRVDDRQNVEVIPSAAWNLGRTTKWTLQASANAIQEHDIICYLYGALKPTIIRLCQDHFAVVVVAATPLDESGSTGWVEIPYLETQLLRDFLLVWDWGSPQGKLEDQGDYETLKTIYKQALEYSNPECSNPEYGEYLGQAITLWNDISILDDLTDYDKADERFLEARNSYMEAFGKKILPRSVSQYGRTLLSFAAGEGHEDIIKLLLKVVNPDMKDGKYGRTSLSYAAENGHEAVVKLLLETGQVEVDSKGKDGQTPLSRAAKGGYEAVVKLLLETGQVEVDSKDENGQTPLSWAARSGHEATVKALLETGQVEVDSRDENGQTPLLWAAANGYEATIKLLFETGQVEVDSKGKDGQTPLSQATKEGYEAVVKLLLETGQVEVNSKDNFLCRTPLVWAARSGNEVMVKLLLETGQVEVDSKDENGQTPLSWAARSGNEPMVKLLLETSEAKVNSKDESGQTPLLWASRKGYEVVVKLLLETGQVEVDLKDKNGHTPLSYAAENGHEAVVKLLLETGQVDVDWKGTYWRRTPLSWAAEYGHEAVVKLLLETGQAEVDSKDEIGRTPLFFAFMYGHEAVVRLLETS